MSAGGSNLAYIISRFQHAEVSLPEAYIPGVSIRTDTFTAKAHPIDISRVHSASMLHFEEEVLQS